MIDVPSPRLEALATRLLPPVSAEDVLGDLAESSRSDREYLRQFMSVLPRVVWTQVRRRATIGGLVFHGIVAAISLLAVLAPLEQAVAWIRAAIPWACWVAACALAAAYGPHRTPVTWNNRVLAAGYLAAVGSAAALGLPTLWIGAGLAAGFAVTLLLSMPWVTSAAPAALSPDTLADHARHFQRLIWWRNMRESLAAVVVIGGNAAELRSGLLGLEWMSHALLTPVLPLGGLWAWLLVFGFVWWLNIKAGESLARQAAEVEALGRHS